MVDPTYSDIKNGFPMSGVLWKHVNLIKGYKKRWFIIHEGFLSYYRNPSETKSNCRATIDLGTSNINSTDNLNITISSNTNKKRSYQLRCLTPDDHAQWLQWFKIGKSKAIELRYSDANLYVSQPTLFLESMQKQIKNKVIHLKKQHDFFVKKLNDSSGASSGTMGYFDQNSTPSNTIDLTNSFNKSTTNAAAAAATATAGHRRKSKTLEQSCLKVLAENLLLASNDLQKVTENLLAQLFDILKQVENNFAQMDGMVEDLGQQLRNLEGQLENGTSVEKNNKFLRSNSSDASFYDAVEVIWDDGTLIQSPSKDLFEGSQFQKKKSFQSDQSKLSVTPTAKARKKSVVGQKKPWTIIPKRQPMKRRCGIPLQSGKVSMNLWTIIRNNLGKELSRISLPVNFSEPLSMLQRLTEDFEYSACLDQAVQSKDSVLAMAFVAAFSVSSYASTAHRISKPFNPLLGETFECDRTDDLGWRSISEQISHHPPIVALHCESSSWVSWQEFTMQSAFHGKNIIVTPKGLTHLILKSNDYHFAWQKVRSTVNNIVVGKPWIDNDGDIEIVNRTTSEICRLTFKAYSYFSDCNRLVTGKIFNSNGEPVYSLRGQWDSHMDGKASAVWDNNTTSLRLWTVAPLPEKAANMFGFSNFALTLNEPEVNVAPTDSRFRPDQRLLEEGKLDEANKVKICLENSQRERLKVNPAEGHKPIWFKKSVDQFTKKSTVEFLEKYWNCKEKKDWSNCPDLFS